MTGYVSLTVGRDIGGALTTGGQTVAPVTVGGRADGYRGALPDAPPVTVLDLGGGIFTAAGIAVSDNGDGTYTTAGTVTDHGDGTVTLAA